MTAASMAPVRIETAADSDAGRLIALVAAFHGEEHPLTLPQREAIRALLRDPSLGRAFILSGEAGDLGYATCLFWHSIDAGGRVATLDDLYVVPSARGRGLGAWFLSAVEAGLAREGVRAVSLSADRADARAVRLYRKRGFAECPLVTFEKALGEIGPGDSLPCPPRQALTSPSMGEVAPQARVGPLAPSLRLHLSPPVPGDPPRRGEGERSQSADDSPRSDSCLLRTSTPPSPTQPRATGSTALRPRP